MLPKSKTINGIAVPVCLFTPFLEAILDILLSLAGFSSCLLSCRTERTCGAVSWTSSPLWVNPLLFAMKL